MHQACVYENKYQYVKSHSTLTEVIAKVYAGGFITQELKEAIETLERGNNSFPHLVLIIGDGSEQLLQIGVLPFEMSMGCE